jgi:hypothetical protein
MTPGTCLPDSLLRGGFVEMRPRVAPNVERDALTEAPIKRTSLSMTQPAPLR